MTLEQVMRTRSGPRWPCYRPPWTRRRRAACCWRSACRKAVSCIGGRSVVRRGFWQFEQGGGVRGVLAHPASAALARQVCQVRGCRRRRRPCTRAWNWTMCWRPRLRGCCFGPIRRLPRTGDADAAWALYLRTWRPGKPHRQTWDALHARRRKRPRSWNMLESWVKRSLGWMAALLAGLAAVAGVYWRGGPGREQSAPTPRPASRPGPCRPARRWNMRENVARSDDDAVAARLKSGWVRGGPEDRR